MTILVFTGMNKRKLQTQKLKNKRCRYFFHTMRETASPLHADTSRPLLSGKSLCFPQGVKGFDVVTARLSQ